MNLLFVAIVEGDYASSIRSDRFKCLISIGDDVVLVHELQLLLKTTTRYISPGSVVADRYVSSVLKVSIKNRIFGRFEFNLSFIWINQLP